MNDTPTEQDNELREQITPLVIEAIENGTFDGYYGDQIADETWNFLKALTSLIKELVAEAKPEKRTPDYYSDSIDLYSRQCAANSRNKAIDEFEQNLLKALEKV